MTESPQTNGPALPSRSLGTVPARTFNFLRTRGVRPTLRKIREHVKNALFDRWYGVRSDQWVALTDLVVVSFGRPVLEAVLANLRRSLISGPRPIPLVYANPLHRQALDDDPFWLAVGETDARGLEEFVHYRPR